jgi:hypothetical protein
MRQFLFLVMTGVASAQTITTHPGVIDLAKNVVTSGQVTFALPPSTDSTGHGVGKFTPSTITCNINMDGTLSGFANGAPNEACVITSNYGGEPGQALSFLGAWNSATSYQTGQAVSYNNAVYISLATENLGNNPATSRSSWSVVVSTASLIGSR